MDLRKRYLRSHRVTRTSKQQVLKERPLKSSNVTAYLSGSTIYSGPIASLTPVTSLSGKTNPKSHGKLPKKSIRSRSGQHSSITVTKRRSPRKHNSLTETTSLVKLNFDIKAVKSNAKRKTVLSVKNVQYSADSPQPLPSTGTRKSSRILRASAKFSSPLSPAGSLLSQNLHPVEEPISSVYEVPAPSQANVIPAVSAIVVVCEIEPAVTPPVNSNIADDISLARPNSRRTSSTRTLPGKTEPPRQLRRSPRKPSLLLTTPSEIDPSEIVSSTPPAEKPTDGLPILSVVRSLRAEFDASIDQLVKSSILNASSEEPPKGPQPDSVPSSSQKKRRKVAEVTPVTLKRRASSVHVSAKKSTKSVSISQPALSTSTRGRKAKSDHFAWNKEFTDLRESTHVESTSFRKKKKFDVRQRVINWFVDGTESATSPSELRKEVSSCSQLSALSSSSQSSSQFKQRMLLESLEEEEPCDMDMMTLTEDELLLASQSRARSRAKSRAASQTSRRSSRSDLSALAAAAPSLVDLTGQSPRIESPSSPSFQTAKSPADLVSPEPSVASPPHSPESWHSAVEDLSEKRQGELDSPQSVICDSEVDLDPCASNGKDGQVNEESSGECALQVNGI